MGEAKQINLKKNALFCPERHQGQLKDDVRVFTWENKIPWYCTHRKLLMATLRPGMRLLCGRTGDYEVAYTQELDPRLQRMRWTLKMIGFDGEHNQLLEFVLDTRELTVHPVTKSWVYQIHTGAEVTIQRHFDDIRTWEWEIYGNGWFKEGMGAEEGA